MRDLPVLADDRVRFVGDKVAAVAADSPDVAEEAANLIEVEYEELPAVFDPLEAMAPDAPLLHIRNLRDYPVPRPAVPDLPNTCAWEKLAARATWPRASPQADHVFEETFRHPPQHQVYLEPHACLVRSRDDGMVDVWASNKAPYLLQGLPGGVPGAARGAFVIHCCRWAATSAAKARLWTCRLLLPGPAHRAAREDRDDLHRGAAGRATRATARS